MPLKPYPKYKPSGLEWVDQIPEHWDPRPLKFDMLRNDGGVWGEDFDEDGTIVLRSTEIGIDGSWNITEPARRKLSNQERQATLLKEGDLVVTKSSGSELHLGKTALVTQDVANLSCTFSNFMQRLRFNKKTYPKYMFYLINGDFGKEQLGYLGTTTTGLRNLSGTIVGNIFGPGPPLAEQQAIADFLDRETAVIDTLIAKNRQLIERLKEKRTVLISHAVTKGLDPAAPMKDSGVEWYGNVPQHWDIKRLGWLTTAIQDIDHKMPNAVDVGIPFLSAKDLLDDGTLNFTNDVKMISEEDFKKLSRKIVPRRGDIIYSRIGARLGKARIVETDQRFLVSYSCCVIRAIPELIDRRYLYHILDSAIVLTEAKIRTMGIGVPDLGLSEIGRFPITVPPLEEQRQLVDYLDTQNIELRELVFKVQSAIDRLQEYRTALISAAVTGKIDVRSHGQGGS